MVYQTGGMTLHQVREIFCGEANDVIVCKNVASTVETYHTLLVIKDRECAKKVLAVFANSEPRDDGQKPYTACFSQGDRLCYLFDYRAERKLDRFAAGQINSVHTWETIGINLVMECLSSPLPYPLLALALEQGNIHIEKDNSIFLTPYFDLSQLTDSSEADCARQCVRVMLELPMPEGAKLKSAKLLRKKMDRNAYRSLPELYMDFKVTALSPKKRKLKSRLKGMWIDSRDFFFRFLLVLAIAMTLFALVILVSQLIFGDIPIFRLFEDRFGQIGTRTLR